MLLSGVSSHRSIRFCLLPLTLVLGLLLGCGQTGIAVSPTSATTSQPATPSARTSYTAFGDSITCGYVDGTAASAPPFSIADAACHTANAYPSYLAASLGLPMHNYAIPGDQACDMWPRQIGPQSVAQPVAQSGSTNSASAPLYTVLIGTNDAHAKGAGVYEPNFLTCELAALTWIALPAESKVPVSSATATGWTLGGAPSLGAYALTTTPGSTLSFTVTTFGGPIYLWRTMSDVVAGTASVTVDGDAAETFTNMPVVPVATQNGTSLTVGVERIAGLPAGRHTVVITDLSGAIAVLGVGTPPQTPPANHPIVLAGGVPAPEQVIGNYLLITDAAYTADTLSLVNTLHADGLDVRFASNATFLTGTTAEMTDLFHVSPLGATHLAAAFQAAGP